MSLVDLSTRTNVKIIIANAIIIIIILTVNLIIDRTNVKIIIDNAIIIILIMIITVNLIIEGASVL